MGPRRTLGYHYREWIVPLQRQAYVLGQASDSSGELRIQRPAESGKPFLISLRSEEQILESARRSARWMGVAAGILLTVGAVLVAWGLARNVLPAGPS